MKERKTSKIIFRALKYFTFLCVMVIVGWGIFSDIDRSSVLTVLPHDYSFVVHSDSLWNSVAPVLDLQTLDALVATPVLAEEREALISFRTSSLRRNSLLQFVASRRTDIAFYGNKNNDSDFVMVADLGLFSAVTRLSFFLGPHIRIKNLFYSKATPLSYYEYHFDSTRFYILPYRNLIIITKSPDLLGKIASLSNEKAYSSEEKTMITKKSKDSFRVVADTRKLIQFVAPDTDLVREITPLLPPESPGEIAFTFSNTDITATITLPFITQEKKSSLIPLLEKESTMPALLTQLDSTVQYYTIFNTGTLAQLKTSLFPLLQNVKDIQLLWDNGESLCHALFSLSLEDIFFSWTGNEYAVLGLEGSNDPVFVLQIQDEEQRRKVFDTITSSLIVDDKAQSVVDGLKLSCIELPPILKKLLSAFGVELPQPYYLVHDGYVYFSESADNLAAIYRNAYSGAKLSLSRKWKMVSADQNPESSCSVYYDLAKSVPFFLANSTIVTNILRQYTIGRCDIRVKKNLLSCQLHASAYNSSAVRLIPGFPLSLTGSPSFDLCTEPGFNPKTVFWIEDGKEIIALDLISMKKYKKEMPETCSLVSAKGECSGGGVLWAVTSGGAVYLLNKKLESVEGFPLLTGSQPTASASAGENRLFIPEPNGRLVIVDDDGKTLNITVDPDASFRSAPSVINNFVALYSKGFSGAVYLLKNGVVQNGSNPISIDGIGFGTPGLADENGVLYTGFITQAGKFYLFKNGILSDGFPLETGNVFFTNVVYNSGAFYALSQNACLYRITIDGRVSSISLPGASSARQGTIISKNGSIYVCPDGNVIYGFTSTFEVLKGFPVAGRGTPVFVDVNGDGTKDCVTMSIDKKLYAWNIK